MTRIISALLVLAGLTVVSPSAIAGEFKKPVYYKLPTRSGPASMVTADFNGDGNLDLAIGDGATSQISVLMGKGKGAFHAAKSFSAQVPSDLGVGDFNGDHIPDLAVVEYAGSGNGTLGIYLGNGDGTFRNFANYQLGSESNSITVADFNGDGHLDVAVTNASGGGQGGSVMVFFGKGNGTFGKPAIYKLPGGPGGIAAGDLNGDGHPDLVVTEAQGNAVAIFMNTGHGKFKKSETYPVACGEPTKPAIADFGHNGSADLAIGCTTGVDVFLGNEDGTFSGPTFYSTQAIGEAVDRVVVADFRHSGNLDLAAVLAVGNPALLYGNGDGTFQSAIPIELHGDEGGSGLVEGDFNYDGWSDLAILTLEPKDVDEVAVLLNAH
jgi:hypothetical protein